MSNTPKWIDDHLESLRDLFWLNQWQIAAEYVDNPAGDLEHGSDGNVTLETRYLTATIQLRRGITQERAKHVLMHEMVHVALARIAQATERISQLLPEELRQHAYELYTDAEEETVERMARALASQIKPTPPAEEAS
jgi:hypothetical protein